MKKELIISGFGGQGVMSVGKSLVEAGMAEGLHVTWAPSYGPEIRGGTANCSVVLSDHPVGSPTFIHPTEVIAMNLPSLLKFEPLVQSGGLIFVNSSFVTETVTRDDVRAIYVPCGEIADQLGNPKVANMVMLGAYVAATKSLHPETIRHMITELFTGKKAKLVDLNFKALDAGMACVNTNL
ncbi:2-oxoacid:acceptor oxidoreductase family protein [Bengtsoniella intestinalis]|uniref:2-oxoacid:acceptor oxidoreductase family protein n=1 Tax=Bengtsoniella intestinalis TaxID=3073143 RepID=UPI00391F7A6C